MPEPIFILRDGHRTFLKWHRARRRADDPVFTGRRILEGMALGASIEVDLVRHGGDGFAVLHDLTLERETTGRGRVRDASAAELRQLHLRANDGAAIPDRVMVLEDLGALIAKAAIHPDALLQLDYKEDAAALSTGAVAAFAAAIGAAAPHFILSSSDPEAVRTLAPGVPGLRVGHDPCSPEAVGRLKAGRDYPAFVASAVAAAPEADLIYLEGDLVLRAAADGFDLVAPFHAAGRRVDAYTLRRADAPGVEAAERLLALKIDQITTDDPEGLAAALDQGSFRGMI